ncbi:MAG: hypothetical protein HZB42_08845 [Sphingobacteriales bacterium]|nr:hypothetical protein [Sphingobacteriales bacterium]
MKKFHCSIFLVFIVTWVSNAQIELNYEYFHSCVPADFDSCIKYSSWGGNKKFVRYYQDQQLTRSCIFSWNNVTQTWNNNPLQEYNYEFDQEGKLSTVNVMIPDPDSNNQSTNGKTNLKFRETYYYNDQSQFHQVLIQNKIKNGWETYKQISFEYKNNRLTRISCQEPMVTSIKDKRRLTGLSPGGMDVQGNKLTKYEYKTVHKKNQGWGTTDYIVFNYLDSGKVEVDQKELNYKDYYYFLDQGFVNMGYVSKAKYVASGIHLSKMSELIVNSITENCKSVNKNKNRITVYYYSQKNLETIRYVYYYNHNFD